jgi:hypothetical protein
LAETIVISPAGGVRERLPFVRKAKPLLFILCEKVGMAFERGERVFYSQTCVVFTRRFKRPAPAVFVAETPRRYTVDVLMLSGHMRRVCVLPENVTPGKGYWTGREEIPMVRNPRLPLTNGMKTDG